MTKALWSLRRRLLLWLLAPLFLLGLVILGFNYDDTRRRTNAVFDRTLGGSALAIVDRVVVGDTGALEVDLPYIALEMLTSTAEDRVFYRVLNDAGTTITGYESLPLPDTVPPIAGDPVFYDATFQGVSIRGAAMAGAASDAVRSIGFTVIIAETTLGRDSETRIAVARSALRIIALIAIAALAVWFGVRKGLGPLERLVGAVGRRNPNDLRPIEHETPVEIASLVNSINEFMARLKMALTSLQRFTGNAGHQLRTPLAVVRANVELARRATDPEDLNEALSAADRATQHAERIVEQFLLLARLEASRGRKEQTERLDLNALSEDTARERAPSALRAGLQLEFERAAEPAIIQANPVLVRELLLNLLNNAITHASPGKAIVRVRRDRDFVVVDVIDDGKGMTNDAIEAALDRGKRLDEAGPHSTGLGLTIASEIASRYRGRLELRSGIEGKGLIASAVLPIWNAEGSADESDRDAPLRG